MPYDTQEPQTSGAPSTKNTKVCLICSDESDGAHFGVESCRACAAFFRRSIVSSKQYICRHAGPGTCEINKTVRCMCRRCRLEKCFTKGMRKDMVQGKRDPIIPKSKDSEPLCAVRPSSSDSSTASPIANVSKPVSLEMEPAFLRRIFSNYKLLCATKRSVELALDLEFASRVDRFGPLAGFALGNSTKMSIYYKAHIPAIWDFVVRSFDEFVILDQEDKWTLFQSFMLVLWGIGNNYNTYKRIPKEYYKHVILLSETMYFDANQCEDFMSDLQYSSSTTREDMFRFLQKCVAKPRQQVLYMMSDMQIEEEEYAALVSLMLWTTNFDNPEDKLDKLKKKMRQKIFDELHIYYRWKQTPNYAERLGELMSLHAFILVDILRFREDLELLNLLEAFQKDNFFYEAIRNTQIA